MKTATGKVIKAFRNHVGYTQQFVADKLNITTATLANLENGRVSLEIEKLYNLAKVFEVPSRVILDLAIEIYENKDDSRLGNVLKHIRPISDKEEQV